MGVRMLSIVAIAHRVATLLAGTLS